MTNQTLHSQIPQSPSPSLEKVGWGLQIRLPIITPELQRLVEKNKKLIKTALPAMEANERRIRELEKQNQQESLNLWYTQEDKELIQDWKIKYPDWYRENWKKLIFWENFIWIEIDWKILKFDKEDLKIEKLDRNYLTVMKDKFNEDGIINHNWHTYFTFNVAQREAGKIWKRLPSKEEWRKIIDFMPWNKDNEKTENLIKTLNLNFAWYFTSLVGPKFPDSNKLSTYWSSSIERNINRKEKIDWIALITGHISILDTHFLSACLLVRCLRD